MRRSYFLSVLAVLLLASTAHAADALFSYYGNWSMGRDNQWSLTFPYYISTKTYASQLGNTTHVILFVGNEIMKSDFPPYLSITKDYVDNGGSSADSLNFLWNGQGNPGTGISDWMSRGGLIHLRDSLHAKGRKLLGCVQAVNASLGWNFVVSDSSRTEMFAKACARYMATWNLDGWDTNVEINQTTTPAEHERFFRIMRRRMPNAILTLAAPPTRYGSYTSGTIQYVDYILPECYVYHSNWQSTPTCGSSAGNGAFLKAPLHRLPNPPGSNHQDLGTWGPDQWFQAGWPKSKIVILLSNEATPYSGNPGNDTLFSCAGWWTPLWSDTAAHAMLSRGGSLVWDNVHVGAYIRGTATSSFTSNGTTIYAGNKFIIPILNNRNIDSVVSWGKAKGYSNFGLYDAGTDARTPDLVKSPRRSYLSSLLSITPSAPVASTIPASSITPNLATLNGMINPNNASTTVRFVWGTVSGVYTDSILAAQSPVSGTTTVAVSRAITGLTINTNYYYRVRAYSSVGSTQGGEVSFMTPAVIQTFSVLSGWNMVSVPLTVLDARKTTLFPTALTDAYEYTGGAYVRRDTLSNRRGYWLKFGSVQSVPIAGFNRDADTISVIPGWNLIGSISFPVSVSSITQVPQGIVQSAFIAFGGSYAQSQTIEPGKSYFVLSNAPGVLILRR